MRWLTLAAVAAALVGCSLDRSLTAQREAEQFYCDARGGQVEYVKGRFLCRGV